MDEKELMVGNYVQTPQNREMFQITSSNLHFSNNYIGVLLTEEWLEKFGFKYIEGLWVKKDLSMGLKNTDYDGDGNKWHFVIGYMLIEIKHVHQLQNLYFALTGEESEIKE